MKMEDSEMEVGKNKKMKDFNRDGEEEGSLILEEMRI